MTQDQPGDDARARSAAADREPDVAPDESAADPVEPVEPVEPDASPAGQRPGEDAATDGRVAARGKGGLVRAPLDYGERENLARDHDGQGGQHANRRPRQQDIRQNAAHSPPVPSCPPQKTEAL